MHEYDEHCIGSILGYICPHSDRLSLGSLAIGGATPPFLVDRHGYIDLESIDEYRVV